MGLDKLLQSIKDAVLGSEEGQDNRDRPGEENVRPASEDPLGDPADQEDADSQNAPDDPRFRNLRPASEDPLGDPADQER